jgi:hypothetical protein
MIAPLEAHHFAFGVEAIVSLHIELVSVSSFRHSSKLS